MAKIEGQIPWNYAEAPRFVPMSPLSAMLLHARLYLARVAQPRAIWPYLLLIGLAAAGGLGLARWSLINAQALQTYVNSYALRGLALCALGLGIAAIRSDTDGGALGYYLLRPRAHFALPLGRWLATGLATAALGFGLIGAISLAAMGTPLHFDSALLARMLLAVVLSASVYPAIFMLIAIYFRNASAMGLGWLVVFDLLSPQLADSFSVGTTIALLSPSHHLTQLIDGVYPDIAQNGNQMANLAAKFMQTGSVAVLPDPYNAWIVPIKILILLGMTVLVLSVSLWRFSRDPPQS